MYIHHYDDELVTLYDDDDHELTIEAHSRKKTSHLRLCVIYLLFINVQVS